MKRTTHVLTNTRLVLNPLKRSLAVSIAATLRPRPIRIPLNLGRFDGGLNAELVTATFPTIEPK